MPLSVTMAPGVIPAPGETSAKSRLASLRKKKLLCQNANKSDVARAQHKKPEHEPADQEKEIDKMAWTAAQWEQYEAKLSVNSGSGFKNQSDLAHATYQKEIGAKSADLDKYKAHMESEQRNFGRDVRLTDADIERVTQSLKDASERKLKRRRRDGAGGDYINEKNRQYNMKLDREYS